MIASPCIQSILKDCVASRDDLIRQEDIILAVNGIGFESITHKALTKFWLINYE